jgi:hypothetical protein
MQCQVAVLRQQLAAAESRVTDLSAALVAVQGERDRLKELCKRIVEANQETGGRLFGVIHELQDALAATEENQQPPTVVL